MGETTAISWTEATWNPWYGCTKVSPGCAHCYMFREQRQYGRDPEVVTRSKTMFKAPLRWKEPRLVFTCSWSDWFHADADEWRDEAWEIVRQTPHLTYQILTKRPERIRDHLPEGWPFPNVWLGVSAEDQETLDARVPLLLETPAAVRFVSAEPLLGPLDFEALDWSADYLRRWQNCPPSLVRDEIIATFKQAGAEAHPSLNALTGWRTDGEDVVSGIDDPHLDWVIVGGESGPKRRPMNLDWARSIRDQCVAAGVPFHFKQVGGLRPSDGGRLLDGRTWDEMPERAGARA